MQNHSFSRWYLWKFLHLKTWVYSLGLSEQHVEFLISLFISLKFNGRKGVITYIYSLHSQNQTFNLMCITLRSDKKWPSYTPKCKPGFFYFSKSWQTCVLQFSLCLTFLKISQKVLITQKWFSHHLKRRCIRCLQYNFRTL